MALRRKHIDLNARTVRVEASTVEVRRGLLTGPTKSDAGKRMVTIPAVLVPELRWHLQRFAEAGSEGRVFVGPKGATPRRSNFAPIWQAATKQAGAEGLHFHDLRHTGNTLAASTGATLRELMERMGHASTRAAMIYLHATRDRDRAIADALSALAEEQLKRRNGAEAASGDGDDSAVSGGPA